MCSHLSATFALILVFILVCFSLSFPLAPHALPLAQDVEVELSLVRVDPSYLEGVLDHLRVQ